MRRARGTYGGSPILRIGGLAFNTETYDASRAGVTLALTKTGYILLRCLMREAPNLVPREKLEQEVWGENRPDSDALRTHLHALRRAIDKPFAFPMLRTFPGLGYKLSATDERP